MPRPDLTEVELSGVKLAVGEAREQLLVEDLKRTQIVMYAGASGDFHPMHTDASYARAMGMPGVFAHGMLTMGIAARPLLQLAQDLAPKRDHPRDGLRAGEVYHARKFLGFLGVLLDQLLSLGLHSDVSRTAIRKVDNTSRETGKEVIEERLNSAVIQMDESKRY